MHPLQVCEVNKLNTSVFLHLGDEGHVCLFFSCQKGGGGVVGVGVVLRIRGSTCLHDGR